MILLTIYVAIFLLPISVIAAFAFLLTEPNPILRLSFIALLLTSFAAAICFGFLFEYQPDPTTRITGFPVPVLVLKFENGKWVDYVGGAGMIINPVCVPSLISLPLSITLIFRGLSRNWRAHRRGFPVTIAPDNSRSGRPGQQV